jgi:diguanylate cyclase (GGDEF)-like protein
MHIATFRSLDRSETRNRLQSAVNTIMDQTGFHRMFVPRTVWRMVSVRFRVGAGFAPALSAVLTLTSGFTAASPASADSREAQARALLAQAEIAAEGDPKAAAEFAERADALLSGSYDQRLRRQARTQVCISHAVFAPAEALQIVEKDLPGARAADDQKAVARLLGCKGNALEMLGRVGAAIDSYEAGLRAAQTSGDRETIASLYAYRGEHRHYLGRYDEALEDLDRAYALHLQTGSERGQRYTLNAIANLYSDPNVGEFDRAIEYYRQLLKSDEALGSEAAIATTLFNIALSYEEKGEYDAALRELRRALEIDRRLGDRDAMAEEERAIGAILVKQGKTAESLDWIERALGYFAESGDRDGIARTRFVRADALHLSRRTGDALRDLDAAERHFSDENNLRYLARIFEKRAKIHAEAGDWRLAYAALKAQREAQAKLDRQLMQKRFSHLRVQFDAARKEQENQALLIENRHRTEALRSAERVRGLQRLAIILGSALLVLLAAMAAQQLYRNRLMRRLAMTDELTGLPNRRSILSYLESEWKGAATPAAPLSAIAFDVDYFKRINDDYGHGGGDKVLRTIAEILRRELQVEHHFGRIGGEEFLIVLPGSDRAAAAAIAERLRLALRAERYDGLDASEGGLLSVTASFGVSERLTDDPGVDALLKRADDALYQAKGQGRDRVVLA